MYNGQFNAYVIELYLQYNVTPTDRDVTPRRPYTIY
ncbi:MAG: hypothetical protein UY09_C0017G0009 [Parcubacteria group bacterium GW2011_GWA2_47_8]|nr:MAG: hypothetical protein UY09_C0017G0009 [Parcubacteria group bacterium GW2011_GWA2_47_8]